MSYVTAVTNHTAAGYINVADVNRIYGNARLASQLTAISWTNITFDDVAAAETTTTPTNILEMINTTLANIERMRLAGEDAGVTGISTEIKDDWLAGAGNPAPIYSHVNIWESTIDAIWEYFGGPALDVCPTLTADLTITTGNYLVVVDCIDTDTFSIILEGTAVLYII